MAEAQILNTPVRNIFPANDKVKWIKITPIPQAANESKVFYKTVNPASGAVNVGFFKLSDDVVGDSGKTGRQVAKMLIDKLLDQTDVTYTATDTAATNIDFTFTDTYSVGGGPPKSAKNDTNHVHFTGSDFS